MTVSSNLDIDLDRLLKIIFNEVLLKVLSVILAVSLLIGLNNEMLGISVSAETVNHTIGGNNGNPLKITVHSNGGVSLYYWPGDKESSRYLKEIRNFVINNNILNIFSPCIGIWEEKAKYECSCFNTVRCYWETPQIFKLLQRRGVAKSKREDIPFNYVVFRKDKVKKYEITRNRQHFVMLSDLKGYSGKTVNVKARIRTVIVKDGIVRISLCDGSCGFLNDDDAVWTRISEKQLHESGIDIPLIAAEKITLKKVGVIASGKKVDLTVDKDTMITVEY